MIGELTNIIYVYKTCLQSIMLSYILKYQLEIPKYRPDDSYFCVVYTCETWIYMTRIIKCFCY